MIVCAAGTLQYESRIADSAEPSRGNSGWMRGKDFNTGLRGVLFDAIHYERMGAALWLYGWLVLRQTRQQGSLGWVLGGAPVSYREIEEETGFNPRTLERWMKTLRRGGYVKTESAPGGLIIWITKAKKFPQGARKFAEAARKAAGGAPRNRAAEERYLPSNPSVAARIGSSSVEGSQSSEPSCLSHEDFHKTVNACGNFARPYDSAGTLESGNAENSSERPPRGPRIESVHPGSPALDARLLRQLLRAEREEAVRRELAVGSGPEV